MTSSHSNPLRAAVWMLGAVLAFTSMAIAGRELADQLDTFEIMTYRSFIGIAVVLIISTMAGTRRQINSQQLGLHMLRNASHFVGQNLWFFAVTLIPFAQLFAFEFSVPIWVALFAPMILNERLTKVRMLAATTGFIGILIVARPTIAGLNIGVMAAAFAAIGFAGSVIFTKLLTRQQSITTILFWLTVMQAIFGIILAGYDGHMRLPSAQNWPWVVLVGFAGLFAHFCVTRALQLAPAIIVSPMDFIRLPLISVIGLLFYNEGFQWPIILGAIIVMGANLMNIVAEHRMARRA